MKFQPSLFLKEALLFAATLAAGIFVAYRLVFALSAAPIVQASSLSPEDLIVFVVIVALVWLASRRPSIAQWVFWIFLSLIILSGSQIVISAFAPLPWDVVGSLAVLIVFLLVKKVLVHDAAIVIAIAGVAAAVGTMITPMVGIIAFILLSFYDIIAVYKTRHMVHIAEGMIRSGAIFGFIIPSRFKLFLAPTKEARARVGSDFMVLGSGDIGLPVIFVSSLVRESVAEASIVAVFVLLGLLLTHILFVNQEKRKPMAALPPIATLTMLGYVIALLLIR